MPLVETIGGGLIGAAGAQVSRGYASVDATATRTARRNEKQLAAATRSVTRSCRASPNCGVRTSIEYSPRRARSHRASTG